MWLLTPSLLIKMKIILLMLVVHADNEPLSYLEVYFCGFATRWCTPSKSDLLIPINWNRLDLVLDL